MKRKHAAVMNRNSDKPALLQHNPKIVDSVKRRIEDEKNDKNFFECLQKVHPPDKVYLELQLRIGHEKDKKCPLIPQTSTFLPGITAGDHAPQHPYSLPSFYYHATPPGESLTTQIHCQEFLVAQDYILQTPKFRISNSLVEILDKNSKPLRGVPANFGENPYHPPKPNDTFTFPREHSVVIFERSKISLKNGAICSTEYGRDVEVKIFLNTVPQTMKILKADFHPKGRSLEVMALMENFTMVGGTLTKTRKPDGTTEHTCTLTEVPGTYGTTDFMVSPDFLSMVRMSKMDSRRTPKMKNIQSKLAQNRREIEKILPAVQIVLNRHRDWAKFHTDPDGFGSTVCAFCNIMVSCGNRLRVHGAFPTDMFPETRGNSWSAREKVVYMASVGAEDVYSLYADREKCVHAQKMIEVGRMVVDGEFKIKGDDDEELLAEYSYQLLFALHGLLLYLVKDNKMKETDKLKTICSMNFFQLYLVEVEVLLRFIQSSASKMFSIVIIDLLCQRATPKHYNRILNLYPKYPSVISRAIQKYPRIILFGVSPVKPARSLIEIVGNELQKTMENYNEVVMEVQESRKMLEEISIEVDADQEDTVVELSASEVSDISMEPAPETQSKPKPKSAQRLFADEQPSKPDPEINPDLFTPHTIVFDDEPTCNYQVCSSPPQKIKPGRRSTADHFAEIFCDSDDDDPQPSTSTPTTKTPIILKKSVDPFQTPTPKKPKFDPIDPFKNMYKTPARRNPELYAQRGRELLARGPVRHNVWGTGILARNPHFDWEKGIVTPKNSAEVKQSPATRSSKKTNSDWMDEAFKKKARRS